MFNPSIVPLSEHTPPGTPAPIECETREEAEKIAEDNKRKFQTVFVIKEGSSDKLIHYKNGKKIK